MKKHTGLFFALASVLLVGTTGAWAENAKGRWDIGGGVYFVSTVDDIRSNSAFVLFDQPGNDGIPNTGDEAILFADPRPDDLLSRETTVNEGLSFNLNFAYGVTDWLSIQIDAGRYEAAVVQLDTWVHQEQFVDFNRDGIFTRAEVEEFEQSQPYSPGNLTQYPVTASLVFRFRKDSPLNPYVGVGVGWNFTDGQANVRLDETNAILEAQEIRSVGTNNFFPTYGVCQGSSCPEFEAFDLQVEDSFMWNLMGGIEYFFNSKVAIFFDAKYNFIQTELKLKSPAYESFDQLHFNYTAVNDTLQYCGDSSFDQGIPIPGGGFTPFPPGFSRSDNGLPGICRPGDPPSAGGVPERLEDQILFQGGSIDLSNFTVGVGVRFYF